MKMMSLITHPHVVSNPQDLRSSSEHKLRYFRWNLRAFWASIDSNATETFPGPETYKNIVKIVHVTSVVHLNFIKNTSTRIRFVRKENKMTSFNYSSLLCQSPLHIHKSTTTDTEIIELKSKWSSLYCFTTAYRLVVNIINTFNASCLKTYNICLNKSAIFSLSPKTRISSKSLTTNISI